MIIPTDGLLITENTVFKPGVFYIPRGIQIQGNGITLDGNGSTLVGEHQSGCGISIANGSAITIKNISILRYYHGIHAIECEKLTVSGCHIHHTGEVPANSIFLDIWIAESQAYGAGIHMVHVQNSLLSGNDLSHQMNGVLAYNCDRLQVINNLASYCSGWGFHLNNTSNSFYENNIADFCCRYEPRGERKGHMGADSSGFLIVNCSNNNIFKHNLARMGGDGFFLAGMTPDNKSVSCNNNLFEENDASYSPNNAFEATFSQGNIFRANYANFSNYGFWLGFSKDGDLENNDIKYNRQAGIATENGVNFQVKHNQFSNNQHGILLWSKHLPEFAASFPENITSHLWQIEQNTFTSNHTAIRIAANQDHGIRPLPENGSLGYPAPAPSRHTIQYNKFVDNDHILDEDGVIDTTFIPDGSNHI